MILAAGLGMRMRPLSELCAKPALPVRGRPVISLLLELLARNGFHEVMINLHHRASTIRTAVANDRPEGLEIHWSDEPAPLGTGGGIRRAAGFLRGEAECVVMAGDMLLDVPLAELLDRHRASGRGTTLLLREDPRADDFGTIGIDDAGGIVRVGETRADGAREAARGLFLGVRLFSRDALADWPLHAGREREVFEDLRDWLLPGIGPGPRSVGAELLDATTSVWEPVGTPPEYLRANLEPPRLPTLGGAAEAWQGEVDLLGERRDVVASRKAIVPDDARLSRCVVWSGERVAPGLDAHDGVHAEGAFWSCLEGPVEEGPR